MNKEPKKPDFKKLQLVAEEDFGLSGGSAQDITTGEIDTYPDVLLSYDERRSLFDEILDNSLGGAIGDGPPIVEVNEIMAEKLKGMAQEFGTTDQRIFEAAWLASIDEPTADLPIPNG